jgi:iron(III) transport system substrate-binding protein
MPLLLILALLLIAAPAARAQNARVAEIASYQGADRAQRILEGAKREGALSLYSNAPTEDNSALAGAFDKKYGIRINLYRASSEDIRQRVLNEYRAKRYDVDLILNNSPAMEALTQEKALQPVKSPYLDDLIPSAGPASRAWVGFCLNVLVQAYNTRLVNKADLPKSYQELLDSDWFAALASVLGEEKAVKLFRDIAAGNGFSVRKGHTLLTNLVSAGEVALALTVFNYTAEQFKKKGAPIDWFIIDPLIAMPNAIALAANAPHPYAAMLLYDFMLSDAQPILVARDYVATSTKVPSPIDIRKLHMMDTAKVLADSDKWQKLYTQIINSR